MTELSVIIATRDRASLLADCLRTLASQKTTAQVEVLVVDDGSIEPLERVVGGFTAATICFSMLRVPPGGLSVARNRGVEASHGDVIAFLDDDTLVAPGWCDGVLGAFRSLGCAGLAGRILLEYEMPRPSWLWVDEHGYLSGLDLGETETLVSGGHVPTGANCAVRREWFDRLGGFRTTLGRDGGSLLSGEDTEFFRRMVQSGGAIGYSPRACVRHRVPPRRLTMAFFVKRGVSQGLSDALMEGKPTTVSEWAAWWRMTAYHIGRIPLVFGKNVVLRRGMLAPATRCAHCVGWLSALKYWWRERQGRRRLAA